MAVPHFTDEQYLALLLLARTRLDTMTKPAAGVDCTVTGYKDTSTNVGLCDETLTTRETAMWPKRFPQNRSLMYRRVHQKCPLDWRASKEVTVHGCFHSCMFFKSKLKDIEKIKWLYDECIRQAEQLV